MDSPAIFKARLCSASMGSEESAVLRVVGLLPSGFANGASAFESVARLLQELYCLAEVPAIAEVKPGDHVTSLGIKAGLL